MLFRKDPFATRDYRRAAVAIVESLGMLRVLAGNYAAQDGRVPTVAGRHFQHQADVDLYPILTTMQGLEAWIDFTGGWTNRQVARMFRALVPLLPPAYQNARLESYGTRIRLSVTAGRHPVKRFHATVVQ